MIWDDSLGSWSVRKEKWRICTVCGGGQAEFKSFSPVALHSRPSVGNRPFLWPGVGVGGGTCGATEAFKAQFLLSPLKFFALQMPRILEFCLSSRFSSRPDFWGRHGWGWVSKEGDNRARFSILLLGQTAFRGNADQCFAPSRLFSVQFRRFRS